MYGQVQRVHLHAAVAVLVREGVVARLSVCLSVPRVAVVRGDRLALVLRMVHCQVQGVSAGAVVGVGVVVSVGAGGRVGGAVPLVAFADGSVQHVVRAMVYRQVQRRHTVAATRERISFRVVATLGIGLSVPFIAAAGSLLYVNMWGRFHREFKRMSSFATVHLFGARAGDYARLRGFRRRYNESVVDVWLALTHLIVECLRLGTVHHNGMRHGVRTSAGCGNCHGVGRGLCG